MSAHPPPSPAALAPGDCYADPLLLPADEAERRIAASVIPVQEVECAGLREAHDRVLAEDLISPLNVPGFTNSAMDGYALCGDDLPGSASRSYEVLGTAWAGKPFTIRAGSEPHGSPDRGEVGPGEAVRVMTGAVMPAGTDTVVMQEQVQVDAAQVTIQTGQIRGQNVRAVGEDIRTGQTVLASGQRLLAAELGLLASLGVAQIRVRRRLRVATFSTGDELRSIGQDLEPGAVYDSNRYTLYAMLTRLGVDIIDLGVIRDDANAISAAFSQAAATADAVITTGGASAGEADFVADTVRDLGQVGFWRIAIRPGRPLAFGRIGDAFMFGLPGNPVAVMVTFYQFVQPALRRMMGERDPRPTPMMRARCVDGLRKKPGRVEYYRAVLERDAQGELCVRQTGKSGSALLHTMSDANCFVVLGHDEDSVPAGTCVDVQPFFGLI